MTSPVHERKPSKRYIWQEITVLETNAPLKQRAHIEIGVRCLGYASR